MRTEKAYCLDIYPESVLRQAIDDYHDICDIEVEIQNHNMICRFLHGKTNEEIIMLEFSNYLIELINSRSKP